MQPFQRQLSLAVLLILVLVALPVARPAYAQTIIVTNLNDSGTGSLREAITLANATSGTTIQFQSGLSGSLLPTTELLPLTGGSTTIDATSANHAIVIDGTYLTASAMPAANGLTIRSNNNTIRGLVIVNFSNSGADSSSAGSGIYIKGGSGNALYGNWLGIESDSVLPRGNYSYGVFLGDGANNNIIGADTDSDRNVITGNLAGGVYLGSATSIQNLDNRIVGNYIGLKPNGSGLPSNLPTTYADLFNAGITVSDGSSGTTISQNVIGGFLPNGSAADVAGIQVTGASAPSMIPTNTTITGNYLGVTKAGGLVANGVGVQLGSFGACGPNETTIGGTDSVDRNIIANNTVGGIYLSNDTSDCIGNASIAGNYIGLNGAGSPQGNGGPGIYIGFTTTVAGTITVGPGNVLSANSTYGIRVRSSNVVIKGNLIGTNTAGTTSTTPITPTARTANAGNASIFLENGSGVVIGGATTADRNIIAYSTLGGGILIAPAIVSETNCNRSACSSGSNIIRGNYIGVSADGATPLNTSYSTSNSAGIILQKTTANTIQGNLIGGLVQGIVLGTSTTSSDNNTIVGNTFGAPASGEIYFATRPLTISAPRLYYEAIFLYRGTGNTISSNLVAYRQARIAGSPAPGIWVGTSTYTDSASLNVIEDNRLVRNGDFDGYGIMVQNSSGVRLSRNTTQFHANPSVTRTYPPNGIYLANGGNGSRAAPTGLAFVAGSPPSIIGNTGCNNGCTVDLFTTSLSTEATAREGPVYLRSGLTIGDGTFSIPVPVCQRYLTATVTDLSNNTSPFSVALDTGTTEPCVPLSFTLGEANPNSQSVLPGNTGTYTHTLTHNATVPLTYTIVLSSTKTPQWASAPFQVMVPAAASGFTSSTDFVVTVAVPSSASATDVTMVRAFAGLVGSNTVTDTTTIGTISPAIPAVSGPLTQQRAGTTVTFSHIVTNTGDLVGTFTVSTPSFASTPSGWNIASVTPASFTLGAKLTQALTIVVNTPSLPSSTTPITLSFNVSTQGTTPITAAQSDYITIPVVRSFSFAPRTTEALTTTGGGTDLSFAYTLTNTGNVTDSFSVNATTPTGGTQTMTTPTVVSVPASPTSLAPGATAAVTVTYRVDATSTTTETYTSLITALGTGISQSRPVTITLIPMVRSFSFTPTASEVITRPAGTANITVTYLLTNTGNVSDSFNVTPSATTPPVAPPITGVMTSTPALTSLAPGATAVVTVTYSVPSGTAEGTYTSTITATAPARAAPLPPSPADQGRVVTLIVVGGGAVVIEPGTPSVNPVLPSVPVTVTFTNIVTNTGNATVPITVGLRTPPPSGWTAHVLATTCPISLTWGTSCTFTVEAVVPAGWPPGVVDLTVFATADNTEMPIAVPNVTYEAPNRVTVGVVRSLVLAPTGLTATGGPSEVVTFTHTLTNTGNAADSFDLTVAQSDSRWTTIVSPTVLTNLAVGVPTTVQVIAVGGANILGGTTNAITLTATGQTNGPSQSVTDTLTMARISAGDLSLGGRNNVDAGQTVSYTLTVTNTGTVATSYTLDLQNSGTGWSAVAGGVPTLVLAPGQTATFTVNVTAPINGATGVTNTTTVRLLVGDGTGSALDTAELVTRIGPRLGIVLTPATGAATGAPGSTVEITHTLTNIGSETGEFTLSTADGIGWPATVTPSFIRLGPGESFIVTVQVRIQENTRAGDINFAAVNIVLLSDPSITAQAIERLTVAQVAKLNLTSSQSRRVSPGETVSLNNLAVINLGSAYDTFNLAVVGASNGWEVVLGQTSLGVDRGDPGAVSVQVKVPPTVASGTVKVLQIEATSRNDATVRDIVQLSLVYIAPTVPPIVTPVPVKLKVYLPVVQR